MISIKFLLFICLLITAVLSVIIIIFINKPNSVKEQRFYIPEIKLYDDYGKEIKYTIMGEYHKPESILYDLPINKYPFIGSHMSASGQKNLFYSKNLTAVIPIIKCQELNFINQYFSYVRFFDLKVAIFDEKMNIDLNLKFIKKYIPGLPDNITFDNDVFIKISNFFKNVLPGIRTVFDELVFIYGDQKDNNAIPIIPMHLDASFQQMCQYAVKAQELIVLNFSGYNKNKSSLVIKRINEYFSIPSRKMQTHYYIIKSVDDLKKSSNYYKKLNKYIIIICDNNYQFTYNNPDKSLTCFQYIPSDKSDFATTYDLIKKYTNNEPLTFGYCSDSCVADKKGYEYVLKTKATDLPSKNLTWKNFIKHIDDRYSNYKNNFINKNDNRINIIDGYFHPVIPNVLEFTEKFLKCGQGEPGFKDLINECLTFYKSIAGFSQSLSCAGLSPISTEEKSYTNLKIAELCKIKKMVPNVILLDNIKNVLVQDPNYPGVAFIDSLSAISALFVVLQYNAKNECKKGGILYKYLQR